MSPAKVEAPSFVKTPLRGRREAMPEHYLNEKGLIGSRRATDGEREGLTAAKVMRAFGELNRSTEVDYGEAMVDGRGMRGAAGRGCG